MIRDFLYELKVQKVLKKIAKQRVALILQPGNVPVIERAIGSDEETQAIILTAQIRGWVEVLHEDMPTGKVDENGYFNKAQPFDKLETYWKLTDSGWAVIQRRHQLSVLSLLVAIIGVIYAVGL